MSDILRALEEYFDNTSKDQLARDLERLEYLNDIGPDALEYVRNIKALIENKENN